MSDQSDQRTQPGDDASELQVEIDQHHRIITIAGVHYAYSLFEQLAFAPIGGRFQIVGRRDGTVELSTIEDASLHAQLGIDAAKWAAEFCRVAKGLGYSDMDEAYLVPIAS